MEGLLDLLESCKQTEQENIGGPFIGRDEELNQFQRYLKEQMDYCGTTYGGKYPLICCFNLSGLGKTTFGRRAFNELHKSEKETLRKGLQTGKKLSIDFGGAQTREYAT